MAERKTKSMNMKKLLWLGTIILTMIFTTACGGGGDGDHRRPVFVAEIISDQPTDGDIAFDSITYTITQGPDTLLFGIDDSDPDLPEYRAFLDFPLDGSSGEDVVPADAEIVSATLDIFINEVSFATVVPTRIELVAYPIADLGALDFDSDPILVQEVNFFASDVGKFVTLDVTPLMREVQQLGLDDFQVRFVLSYTTDFGFVGFEDEATVGVTAPLLTVEYK
jgi:hypothetical protein